MKLKSIELTNYRSINSVKISLKRIYGSNTYCLFGINESGKSSFLTGLAQYDEKDINYPIDYFDDTQPVKLIFEYQLDKDDNFGLRNKLEKDFDFPKEVLRKISVANVGIEISYTPNEESKRSLKEEIQFKTSKFVGYKLEDSKLIKTDSDGEFFDMHEFMLNNLSDHFWAFSHKIVLWSAMDIYLIKDEIDLNEFMENPTGISIPLTNAFALSGISENEIENTISKLKDPASIRNLESLLSEEVTNHILKVWRNHPIKVLFKINENKITLLVEDDGVKHKSKLTHQRSDGFRQFISFLLSISAESNNDELTNTMMLLDEPETHLHPQAQIDLI
ncbi:AAA family ATPase [Pontimicrobium aquaticum]|nr:AAA family ATPase [Pontimicrobium aquaticum]